jgi:hypothetical protein
MAFDLAKNPVHGGSPQAFRFLQGGVPGRDR